MKWRPYALGVAISAGAFVTGVMWRQRPSPYTAAEDMAAFTADAFERFAVMWPDGETWTDDTYFNSTVFDASRFTNRVNAARTWDTQYEGPGPLWQTGPAGMFWALKAQFGNTEYFYKLPASRPHWLDGAWPHDSRSDVLIYQKPDWVTVEEESEYYTKYYHSVSSPTSVTPTYVTLDTRIKRGDAAQYYHATPTNIPAAYDFPQCPETPNGSPIVSGYNPYPNTGNWWTENGYGTNAYYFTQEWNPDSNWYGRPMDLQLKSYSLNTNMLNQLREICGVMKEAVMINRFSYSNIVRYVGSASASDSESKDEEPPEDDPFALDAHSAAMIQSMATAKTNGVYSLNGAAGGICEYNGEAYAASALYHYDAVGNPPYDQPGERPATNSWSYNRIATAVATIEATKYLGVFCPWPPEWAYRSNLVKRVRYFVAWSAAEPGNFEYVWLVSGQTPYDTFTSTAISPNFYGARRFPDDITRVMSKRIGPTVQSSGFSYHFLSDSEPEKLTLEKIVDEQNPITAPRVDIGVDVANIVTPFYPAQTASWFWDDDQVNYGGTTTRHRSRFRFLHRHCLKLEVFLCVVEFDFSNFMSGGKGEPYSPPWSTNSLSWISVTNAPPVTP